MAEAKKRTTTKSTGTKRTTKTAAKEKQEKATAEEVVTAPVVEDKSAELISEAEAKAEAAREEVANLKAQNEALMRQIAEINAKLDSASRPQVIQISQDSEKVQFLWQAEVAEDNVVTFGDGGMYGRIQGKTGVFYVPKSDLSRVMDATNRFYLDKRWLIVTDGLTQDEREALGVDYKEGEILDRKAFAKMVDLKEEILEIYPKLCPAHKEMVAKRYNDAYASGNINVTREIVVELNRLSKLAGSEKGDFIEIIEQMNAKDAES